jgi:sugar O-acyltransferase (sialic acid O-acetyltransferase NeuD family)
MKVLILGAGGHGQVIADILVQMQRNGHTLEILGYLDDNAERSGLSLLGFPVLGQFAQLKTIEHDAVIIGVGSNSARYDLYERLLQSGEHFVTACHPSAVIGSGVSIEPGTVIGAGVIVNPVTTIGANVILNTGCTVDHHNHIGAHAHIAPGSHLGGDVNIGIGTLVGIGATVMPQRNIGDWSIVGAGSVVTRSIPDQVVVTGVPAQIVRQNDHLVSPP